MLWTPFKFQEGKVKHTQISLGMWGGSPTCKKCCVVVTSCNMDYFLVCQGGHQSWRIMVVIITDTQLSEVSSPPCIDWKQTMFQHQVTDIMQLHALTENLTLITQRSYEAPFQPNPNLPFYQQRLIKLSDTPSAQLQNENCKSENTCWIEFRKPLLYKAEHWASL